MNYVSIQFRCKTNSTVILRFISYNVIDKANDVNFWNWIEDVLLRFNFPPSFMETAYQIFHNRRSKYGTSMPP